MACLFTTSATLSGYKRSSSGASAETGMSELSALCGIWEGIVAAEAVPLNVNCPLLKRGWSETSCPILLVFAFISDISPSIGFGESITELSDFVRLKRFSSYFVLFSLVDKGDLKLKDKFFRWLCFNAVDMVGHKRRNFLQISKK